MTPSDERLAKNEAHFREVNERLDKISTWRATMTDFLCECSAITCIETIGLTNDELNGPVAARRCSCSSQATKGLTWVNSKAAGAVVPFPTPGGCGYRGVLVRADGAVPGGTAPAVCPSREIDKPAVFALRRG